MGVPIRCLKIATSKSLPSRTKSFRFFPVLLVNHLEKGDPAPAEFAQQLIKDPYSFDFLTLGPERLERDLERGLLEHLRSLILELGNGFAFVGIQYRLDVGKQDFYRPPILPPASALQLFVQMISAHRAASPRRYSAVSSSNCFLTSPSSARSAAESVSDNLSRRLAPRITEVMTGFASTHTIASVASSLPRSFAMAGSCSTVSYWRRCQ